MVHPANQRTRIVAIIAFVATSLVLATLAQARTETLRWTHPQSDALDFELRITSLADSATQILGLGIPGQPVGTEYVEQVEVGDGDVELELRAVGPGGERSVWTSAQLRTGPIAPPPPEPEPEPEPTGEVAPGGGTEIPPTTGAAARFDFENSAPGTDVAGWVDTTPNHGLGVDDSLFAVIEVDGNRMLHTDSTANAIQSTATADVRSNFEVRGRMAMSHPESEIGVTTYSRFPTESVHYRIAANSGETFRFVGRPSVVCASSDSGVRPTAGEWIRFELDVREEGGQNRIVAKVWPADSAEPAAPQIDCVDSSASRPTEGSVGAWSGGPGLKYWDDFEIFQGITGGGSSPTAPLPPLLIQIVPFEDN